eukprot:SAG25_NODE_490_length_7426_cov_3.764706_7_plen_194_part_00
MREIRWDPTLESLVENPVRELETLRNASIANVTGIKLAPKQLYHITGTGGGAAASADIVVRFALPSAGRVAMVGVTVLAGVAPWGQGRPDDSGVDVMVNISAPNGTGWRHANMTIARRYHACDYPGCCPNGNDNNCTERTFDNCQGPLSFCDGDKAPNKQLCRFGHPSGNCGAASFTILPREKALNLRVLVDR